MFQVQIPCESYDQAQAMLNVIRRPFPNQQVHICLPNGVALFDLRRWYENHLPDHPLMDELQEQGWQLTPFADIPDGELEALSELVELFSEGPEYLSPELREEPDTAAELAEQFAEWLTAPEDQSAAAAPSPETPTAL